MALLKSEVELVNSLNSIFNEGDSNAVLKISLDNLRNPTVDFTRNIIVHILTEAGFALNSSVMDLTNELSGAGEINMIKEYMTPVTLTVTAQEFFDKLSEASGHNPPKFRFGLNDIIMPEHKRLKYFLDQFVNYWLFCNYIHEQFKETYENAKQKSDQKMQFETNIRIFRKRNEELKVDKANIAMKSQKLKDKLAQDKAKVEKLSEDVSAFNHQTAQVKEELQNYKEKEAQLMKCNEELEKNETRLKTIADADGIKHELESKLEALKVEGSEKMIQIQNYRLKEGKCESAEKLWRDILSNCSIVVNLSDAMKKKFEEKKSLMIDHETSNENLEFVEKQLLDVQKLIHVLKADIALAKQKWEKTKSLRESDLLEYTEKLKSLSIATSEDDIIMNEVDTKINETMMATVEVNEEMSKEQEKIEKLYQKLVQAFDQFFEKTINECNNLKRAREALLEKMG